ncbi:ABC transporter permease [Vallitalea longa]|uniref:ABC transporter permease n=1 Tax=Vallitalea longa TaxID=2936439 RepID=A0A9W6DDW1_9FIRM|nr:sugar ABC transporter permease [Vallitalea longa]GKX29446.1 ABC transporter permease [Vallitalea longa]
MKQSKVGFWLFLLPSLLAFTIVVLIPAIWGLGYSLTDWNGISHNVHFVGFQNYKTIFLGDKDFLHAFLFTTLFSFCAVIFINVVGFALALLVTSKVKCSTFMRTVFFMPNLIGGILLGFIWQFIFIQGFGAISKITGIQGFSNWLSDTTTSFWGLLILITWQLSGYMMIIYIAYIQSISNDLIEAAQIDGANYIQRLRKIVIPLVRPAFTIGMFLSLSTCFKLYDQNLALTNGGPYNSTEMLALNIYNTAFKYNDLGLAQAKAVIFLIAVATIGLIQLYFNKKKEAEM